MKCKACDNTAQPDGVYCSRCQTVCNKVAMKKMFNSEPLPDGHTLDRVFYKIIKKYA